MLAICHIFCYMLYAIYIIILIQNNLRQNVSPKFFVATPNSNIYLELYIFGDEYIQSSHSNLRALFPLRVH